MHPAVIGPFKIERELGRGGMGEVYLARDTRLDRLVAIKALPAHLAQDQDRLARFQREAKVLASLNHPGIGAIYGLEEAEGHQYLILEYIEGQTLASRLARGPLPVDEALVLAKQIAEALEVAHEKGVVHRDLKPGNVMVTPDGVVKVLDFGLARSAEGSALSPSNPAIADSPTITSPANAPVNSPTISGVIMGTAGYMSPEQARGKPVDKRSDIFSFGCVLHEMLTGTRPFGGETVADSIGATLHKEPDLNLLPAHTPQRVRELLASCLAKDRKHRLHDIGDARLTIERAEHEPPSPIGTQHRPIRDRVAWGLLVIATGAALAGWLSRGKSSSDSPEPPMRFTIPAPPGLAVSPESVDCAISPDGRRVAFVVRVGSQAGTLWIRDLQDLTSRQLAGTEGARMPFWSPDSRSIGFFSEGALCRIEAAGGPVQRLADAPVARGGAWSETGVILFAPMANAPLKLVPQTGGPTTDALGLNTSEGETGHRFPEFLPGGKKFVYTSMGSSRESSDERTFVASLGDKQGRLVLVSDGRATYAEPGWLLFMRSEMLYAQRFDPATGALSGDAVATGIQPGGAMNYGGRFSVTASRTGTIVCPIDGVLRTQMVQFGPDGKPARTLALPPVEYQEPRVSADGEHMAVVASPSSLRSEIRIIDLTREGVWSRIPEVVRGFAACWAPDDRTLYFSINRNSRDLFRWEVGGASEPELFLETGNLWAHPRDVSPDGRSLIYNVLDPKNARDLLVLDLNTKKSRPLATSPASEYDARFSPDGKLVALAIEEAGGAELYIQQFPDAAGRVRVSIAGLAAIDTSTGQRSAAAFRWSRDGSSIFFFDSDQRTVKSATVKARDGKIEVSKPETIAELPPDVQQFEIGPDARSFYGAVRAQGQPDCSISVTTNWQRLLPTK